MTEDVKKNGSDELSTLKSTKQAISIGSNLKLRPRVDKQGFSVADSDWNYLRTKISNITTPKLSYNNMGYTAFGIAFTGLVGAIGLESNAKVFGIQSNVICWMVFIIFLIGSIFAFLLSAGQRTNTIRLKDDALEEMKRIENQCKPIIPND